MLLRSYLDGRVLESLIPLSNRAEHQVLLAKAGQDQGALWDYALQAAESDKSEVTSRLFIAALNELIDSFGRRGPYHATGCNHLGGHYGNYKSTETGAR